MNELRFQEVLAKLKAMGNRVYPRENLEVSQVLCGARRRKRGGGASGETAEEAACGFADSLLAIQPASPPSCLAVEVLNEQEDATTEAATAPPKKAKQIPGGTLLFVGCYRTEEAPRWTITRPTPFNRMLQSALTHTDAKARTVALVRLASRLTDRKIKESILRAARVSAQLSSPQDRDSLIKRVASVGDVASPAHHIDPPTEPDCDAGAYRGRFVMLHANGTERVHGRLSSGAVLFGGDWRTTWKIVHFIAEVEVAPNLLLRSVDESRTHDPESARSWRRWIEHRLANNKALAQSLLARLPPA
jgi:hypothetical protein